LEFKYYIVKDVFINDKESLKSGVRIQKIPAVYTINFKNGEGPFDDLPTLKKKSTIFRNILLRNSKRAQQICLEKNICVVKNFALTEKGFSVDMNFINVFQHCIKGQIKKGKVSGVHYYDSDTMKILKINKLDESSGVWEAEIEIFDKKTNKWIKKDSTTFFPKDWSMHQLFHECVYAVKNMKKKVNSKNIFTSLTETGVKVEIISVNNEMKSIYPILD
jgi:hypothetical protein